MINIFILLFLFTFLISAASWSVGSSALYILLTSVTFGSTSVPYDQSEEGTDERREDTGGGTGLQGRMLYGGNLGSGKSLT